MRFGREWRHSRSGACTRAQRRSTDNQRLRRGQSRPANVSCDGLHERDRQGGDQDRALRRIDNGTILNPNGGFDPRHYPGEVILSTLALGTEFSDQRLTTWSFAQVDSIRQSLAANNGFWIEPPRADWPNQVLPVFGQLSQARLLLSLSYIYARTRYAAAREAALLAYSGLQRMPRSLIASRVTGRQYLLTHYQYENTSNPVALTARELSPNHDAVIAAAYLAAATFVLEGQDEISRALDQLNIFKAAAVDLASPDRCLPLDGHPDYLNACDTRYNGYWASSLAIILSLRSDDSVRQALEGQRAYVRQALLGFQTNRTYPTPFQGNYPDPVEPVLFWPNLTLFLSADEARTYVSRTNSLIESQDASRWPSGNLYPAYHF